MEEALRERLEAADDPIHLEHPPELDDLSPVEVVEYWDEINERLERLERKLSRIAGRTFVLDDEVQDATFFGDLSIDRLAEAGAFESVFVVRFSNFGSLFTAWSSPGMERLHDDVIAELVRAVSFAGFHYVPTDVLYTPYTGRHPYFAGSTWWMRFFDYT